MTAAPWPAPAKLNLFLHITGQRADGYHTLQTLFQFLDFGDSLTVEAASDGELHYATSLTGVAAEDDLVLRAAKMLQVESGCSVGANISLTKRLPVGGGLGGGSSDAATTLVALNHIWQLNLTTEQLAAIGLRLGADVPVFVYGIAAWAEGVGEELQPQPDLPEPWYLLLIPECRVATAAVFADSQLTRDSAPITIAGFLAGGARNDCEPVVRKRYQEVNLALNWLANYGAARLTGTGASIFADFATKEEALEVQAQVPAAWQGVVTRGLNRSPLLDRLVG